jgi:uncharacterized membrane protein
MTPNELRHYSDVRRVLPWLTRLLAVTAAAILLLAILRPRRRPDLRRIHRAGLLLWLGVSLVAAMLAWWDWKLFFSWIHHPIFGPDSWRFSKDAHSLQLFPASFWRALLAVIALTPALVLALTARALSAASRANPR